MILAVVAAAQMHPEVPAPDSGACEDCPDQESSSNRGLTSQTRDSMEQRRDWTRLDLRKRLASLQISRMIVLKPA
jgi:hypothetical protein